MLNPRSFGPYEIPDVRRANGHERAFDIFIQEKRRYQREGAHLKIVAINGSPRTQGNTSAMIKEILKMAEASGSEVSYHDLVSMSINDCKACMKCKKESSCSQLDDMERLRPLIEQADLLVLGSPVYMGDQTGIMKCFVDRLYRFMVPDEKKEGFKSSLGPGKKALVLFTCQMANGNMLYNYILVKYYNLLVNMLGYEDIRTFIVGGANPAEDLRGTPQAKVVLEECGRFVSGR
jgi:multimeric flavodoxin WrbA